MQATVRRFDARTKGGDVLLDDGSLLAFTAEAFQSSGLRLLRVGQRVQLSVDASGAVAAISIVTFPDRT